MTASETFGADDRVRVDLPDVDPSSTRYFWTVVPVGIIVDESGTFTYYDAESPQDACESGRVASFGKESRPVITTAGTPYVSGLSPKGRLLAQAGSRPIVYSTPLVSWRPSWVRRPTRCSGRAASTVAVARICAHVRDVVRASAELRSLVLPHPRTQRRADGHARHDLVGAVAVKVVRPIFRISGG